MAALVHSARWYTAPVAVNDVITLLWAVDDDAITAAGVLITAAAAAVGGIHQRCSCTGASV